MPAQQGLGLDDLQDLFPIRPIGRRSRRQERQPVAPGQMRGLHLAMQHNQLLTKEGVLGEQLGPAAREISQRAGGEVGAGGLSEVAEELVGGGGETCP